MQGGVGANPHQAAPRGRLSGVNSNVATTCDEDDEQSAFRTSMSGGLLPKHVRCVREPCGNGDLTGVDATYATITPQVRPAVQSLQQFLQRNHSRFIEEECSISRS